MGAAPRSSSVPGDPSIQEDSTSSVRERSRLASATYWLVTVVLIGFGTVAIFSIGAPFLVLGLALLAFAPVRDRPTIVWPGLAFITGLIATFVLTIPFSCSAAATSRSDGTTTVEQQTCRNLLGIEFGETGTAHFVVPLLVAMGVGVIAGVLARVIASRLQS